MVDPTGSIILNNFLVGKTCFLRKGTRLRRLSLNKYIIGRLSGEYLTSRYVFNRIAKKRR